MICALLPHIFSHCRLYYWMLNAYIIPWASSSSSPLPSSLFACLPISIYIYIYCANQLDSRWKSIFSNQIALNLMMLARSKDAHGIFSMFTSLHFVCTLRGVNVCVFSFINIQRSCALACSFFHLQLTRTQKLSFTVSHSISCALFCILQHSIILVAISIRYWLPVWNGVVAVTRISITWWFIGLALVLALFYRCHCINMM